MTNVGHRSRLQSLAASTRALERFIDLAQHEHEWTEIRRDSNENRTRTLDRCRCGALRSGCLAKRLDDNGVPAWGPVGVQTYRVM